MSRYSDIEQIAADIEAWGDGWRFLFNPDDGGDRARLCRSHSLTLDVEIEIHDAGPDGYFVFIAGHNRGSDGRWDTVSASVRNPLNRRTVRYINNRLDELEVARQARAGQRAEGETANGE